MKQLWSLARGYWTKIRSADGSRALAYENFGWLMTEKVVRIGFGLAVSALMARYLGSGQFGQFSYAVAWVSLFGAFFTLGLESVAVRHLVEAPERAKHILGSALCLRLIGAAVGIGACVIGIRFIRSDPPEIPLMVTILAFGSPFLAWEVVDYWFQSRVRSRFAVLARLAAFVAMGVARIVLVLKGAGIVAFAWVGLAEAGLTGIALASSYLLSGGRISEWRWSGSTAWRMLRDSWPFIFSALMVMVYMRIDQIMLARLANDEEVGIYSVAVRLAEVWYFIPAALISTIFPSIVQALKTSEADFYARLQKLYQRAVLLSYAISVVVSLAAYPVIALFFGAAYAGAAPILIILIWGVVFVSLGMARSSFLMAMNWSKTHFVTVALGGIANIALNLVLIPKWGGVGAAVASLFSYWLAAHGSCFLVPGLSRTGGMLTRAMLRPGI